MGHWPSTQPCFDWQNVCTSGESNFGLVRGKDLCHHYTTSEPDPQQRGQGGGEPAAATGADRRPHLLGAVGCCLAVVPLGWLLRRARCARNQWRWLRFSAVTPSGTRRQCVAVPVHLCLLVRCCACRAAARCAFSGIPLSPLSSLAAGCPLLQCGPRPPAWPLPRLLCRGGWRL